MPLSIDCAPRVDRGACRRLGSGSTPLAAGLQPARSAFHSGSEVLCYSRDERRDELPRPRPARGAASGGRRSRSVEPSSGRCSPCCSCAPARSYRCERLVDEVWGDEPPPSAAHTLESYVSRLRQLFTGHGPRLVRRGAGYALELADATLDARGFVELQERASLAAAMEEHAEVRRADGCSTRDVARSGPRRRRAGIGRTRRGRPTRGAPAPHVRASLRRRADSRPPRACDRGAAEARRAESVPGALRRTAHARALSLRSARGGTRHLRADAPSPRRGPRPPAEHRSPAAVRADRPPGPTASASRDYHGRRSFRLFCSAAVHAGWPSSFWSGPSSQPSWL